MNGPMKKLGATRAVSTSAVAASGAPLMSAASAVIANRPTQSPNAEMTCASHSHEYSRDTRKRSRQPCPSGASRVADRSRAGDDIRAILRVALAGLREPGSGLEDDQSSATAAAAGAFFAAAFLAGAFFFAAAFFLAGAFFFAAAFFFDGP